MTVPFPFRTGLAALILIAAVSPPGAAAPPPLPAACDLAKAADLAPVIGGDAHFIPMIDTRNKKAAMTMCAYEGKDGRHYGLSVRRTFGEAGKTAERMRADMIETLRRQTPDIPAVTPDIGEAALWLPTTQQLTVWLEGGQLTLTFIGDETTPDLATHLAIARKVLQALAK